MILSVILMTLVVTSLAGCTQQNETNGKNTFYVGTTDSDYRTIQEAVNAAADNTTIIIRTGSYNELITINTSITLRGEDKNTTIINLNPDSNITQIPIITINADNCVIENLHITKSKQSMIATGIAVHSNNNTIQNTLITGLNDGIILSANSDYNIILHNQLRNNINGISSANAKNNNISYNIFSNTIYNIYLELNSNKNLISFNVMNNSTYGLRIKGSQNNLVYKNCIKNNDVGVYFCCGAGMNRVYNNSLVNNVENAKENSNLVNAWYNYETLTGNYWDDYNGSDINQDGKGDTAFVIESAGNTDEYPLMNPPSDVPCDE